jgi:ribosomal protein L25 (general stress protein Ctc)
MFIMHNALPNIKFVHFQVLHDAFFKYQTKPKLTGVGDLYYEGKEFEVLMLSL